MSGPTPWTSAECPAFYSPRRIHYLLVSWEELVALAESPNTARNLLRPGETPIEPRIRQPKGAPSDPLRWADVVADVQAAHSQLSSGGVGVAAVAAAMSGVAPAAFAQQHGADVLAVYRATVGKMATWLEGGTSGA